MSLTYEITKAIEATFNMGGRDYSHNIIIFPCGDVGFKTIEILKTIYGIEPAYLIDNFKCKYSSKIHNISVLKDLSDDYAIILTSTNVELYNNLKEMVKNAFLSDRIIELDSMKNKRSFKMPVFHTDIGKHSFGPICRNHPYIERIGAFCSFAEGVEYVGNHETRYISTHTMIHQGKNIEGYDYPKAYYEHVFLGNEPIGELVKKQNRAYIGNDVWLGKNVIITNSANTGDGVVAGAGSVITKDVPDYAIVMGVPARISRFRYNSDQIKALKAISWWDWSDDVIKSRFEDFYKPIDEFIRKYI